MRKIGINVIASDLVQLVPIVLTDSNTYGKPTNEKDVTVKQTTQAVDTVTINT